MRQNKKSMKTFVLIHGSWHSAWNWHRLIPIIEKQGHKAVAIDLPGMGRDKTPINEVRMHSSPHKIECTEDRAVTPFIQQKMYTEKPCENVYSLATSHSLFFRVCFKIKF